ncbi:uncharacterized protein BJ171DRAFT_596153 [Polychytrium aggregatum]|uniref:uncharacterized protein n=1 Tax=Polychytrium aggregatum TaxID=110093 RepID=UPI0022FDE70C|nr:uncharacterized protein BJ171DRAFT_596153 [Polychytrium aggregatum]KAI9208377.1 hypothetical protein BJ171DRAFT_596153 [Polychytrium aggregatum]
MSDPGFLTEEIAQSLSDSEKAYRSYLLDTLITNLVVLREQTWIGNDDFDTISNALNLEKFDPVSAALGPNLESAARGIGNTYYDDPTRKNGIRGLLKGTNYGRGHRPPNSANDEDDQADDYQQQQQQRSRQGSSASTSSGGKLGAFGSQVGGAATRGLKKLGTMTSGAASSITRKNSEPSPVRRSSTLTSPTTISRPSIEPESSKFDFYYVGISEFISDEPGDLSFREGDVIEVIEEVDENWCEGRCRGKEGLFPVTYCRKEHRGSSGPPKLPYRR